MHPLGYVKPTKLVTNRDLVIVKEVSEKLVEVGNHDDVARLRKLIEDGASKDKLETACEIAIAWIRLSQDLKQDLIEQSMCGYL